MIDLGRVARLYPEGLCWVEKREDGCDYVMLFKRFDNETGRELFPEPQYFTKAELEAWQNELETKLTAVKLIKNSLEIINKQ